MGKLVDRAKMTITTVAGAGLGNITLGVASTNYNTFALAGVADQETVSYVAEDPSGAWEYGQGIYTASTKVLARTPIYSSAGAATAAVITTNGAVFIDALAEDIGPDFMNINKQTALFNYTLPATSNALSVGPVTVASGFAVTVSTGARWVVL